MYRVIEKIQARLSKITGPTINGHTFMFPYVRSIRVLFALNARMYVWPVFHSKRLVVAARCSKQSKKKSQKNEEEIKTNCV